ncbi:allergen Tha p 1-like [Nylanderia fulva]|uniref:allergen Tha p 1-like n=1 Tax=Nylanderia fulva TaxID=613905 RepID=UPI0010FB2E4E|nr:allergen Tha p 1-like [Nylanderia fulva]
MELTFILLSSFMFSGLVLGMEGTYSTMYDNVDVNAILQSDRLLNQYMDCALDRGPCTADARSLKRALPEAVSTICEKCNSKQKQAAKKIGNHLKNYRPDLWTDFLGKFDPEGEYVANFEKFLAQVEE